MIQTPLRRVEEENDAKDDSEPGADSVDEIVGTFTGMKLVNQGPKRVIEKDTAEGSPVNIKRLDLEDTPHILKVDRVFVSPKDDLSREIDQLDAKLLIICAASDEHETGDHQENSLRTALLCGPTGCLRRAELQSSVSFIDSEYIEAAPLVDLLR